MDSNIYFEMSLFVVEAIQKSFQMGSEGFEPVTTRLPVKLSNHQAIAHNYYTDQRTPYYNTKRSVRLQQHIIHVYMGDVWGTRVPIRLNCLKYN